MARMKTWLLWANTGGIGGMLIVSHPLSTLFVFMPCEGTMSDIHYDPSQCRNITLDIRYCLFIIDKFAGAQRLIDELEIRR